MKIINPFGSFQVFQQQKNESLRLHPLYIADVILEHEVLVSILVRGLFLMLFMIVLGTKIIIRLKNGTSINPIIHFISKFGDHNHLLLKSEHEYS